MPCKKCIGTRFMSKVPQFLAVMGDVTKQDTYVTKQDTILDLYHLKLGVWLKMVQYSAVDIRTHHQSAADHHLTLYTWLHCQNVLFGNIPFENQDYFAFKNQNEVSHLLNFMTIIITINFRLFPHKKSKNFQNVLFGNCSIGNYRMLL